MEMHQLRYFIAVAEEGNFTRAAARCFVSQPSLSNQILKLEEELGQRLFDRLGRRTELTAAGRQFEKRARTILFEVENASRELRDASGEIRGLVRVGMTPSIGPYLAPILLELSKERYPDLEVRIEENLRRSILDNLEAGVIDIAVSSYTGDIPYFDAEPILQESLNLVVPSDHRLAAKDIISIRDFAKEPLVVLGESSTLGERIMEFFGLNDFEPQVVALCSQVQTVKSLVEKGVGVAILPEMAKGDMTTEDLIFKPMVSARMNRLVFALTHEKRFLGVAGEAFIGLLREYADTRARA